MKIKKNIDEMTETEKVEAALYAASVEVIKTAQRTCTPIIIWKDGEVVKMSVEEFLKDHPFDEFQ